MTTSVEQGIDLPSDRAAGGLFARERSTRVLRLHSLRGAFIGLAVLVVAVTASLVLYERASADDSARHTAERQASAAAAVAAQQIEASIGTFRQEVAGLADDPIIVTALSDPAACGLSSSFTVGSHNIRGHMDFLRPDGAVVCSSMALPGGRPYTGYVGQSWVSSARSITATRAPAFDPRLHAPVLRITMPALDRTGIVAASVELAPIAPTLAELYGEGNPDEFLITDSDGVVLSRSIDPATSVGRSVAGTRFARAGGALPTRDLDGTPRVYGEHSLAGLGWNVFVGEDTHDALAAASGLFHRELEITLVGLALVLLTLAFVYRQLARPIARLASAVQANAAAADHVRVPIAGPSEVRTLGEDINGLMDAVDVELRRREQAEAHARDLARSYRILFDRHPEPMWLYDPETLRFLTVNEAAVTSYGYSRDEFLAMTVEDIAPPDDRGKLQQWLALHSGHQAPEVWRHRKKDGTLIEVAVSSNTVEFEGRPARLMLAQDVTEQQRLEQHVRQAQKMEAVGNLAGGIAHDFNNTLTVIRATLDLLEPSLQDETTRKRIQQIELAAEHAATLTRQLLAFSRLQVLHPEPLDLNAVVNESLDLASRVLPENILVESHLASALAPIMADRGQVQQVILNLAINARDAMPDGGKLTALTSDVVIDERYAATEPDLMPGHYLLFELTDTGSGIDPETQSRVFDPFFTTKKEGTGLGLATVYGIVKQSGGHITFYSEPGLGTTFRVYLPPADSPTKKPVPKPAKPLPQRGSETILLVEDAELLRPLTVEVLTGFGYNVLSAADGEAALAIAAEHEGVIDLLLTDVVMPGMNGRELFERLREARPGLRVIFTSGYPADNMIRHGIATAQVAFIQKPYLASDLASQVRSVLEQ